MQDLQTDIAIIGGGIAGLWALNQLRNSGYSAILFEQESLGGYQTIASQGMIHGGVKYALGGSLSGGSEAISAMPDLWRRCLQGEGKVDLRGTRVLSEDFFLWSGASLTSRFTSFFASKMLRGRVEKLQAENYPLPLRDPQFRGQVYRLVDLVLDVPSLVEVLAQRHREAIFKIDWQQAKLERDNGKASLLLPGCRISPECLLLTAGTGNETLIEQLGAPGPAMQRRPLQQVIVKHQYPEVLYAHAMGSNPSPRLTISSHRSSDGQAIWYLGGDLATEGVNDEPAVLIAKAKRELSQLFPWLDFGESQWRTLKIDRAEPKQSNLLKPDQAFVAPVVGLDNVLAAWPTKLTLSPNLADAIETKLAALNIQPRHQPELSLLSDLGRPGFAPAPWDSLFA
ncbi:MAG: FAD-dependent oxidoreductase [Proteobacteria bacterium]|nr:FAD-dependent oxidoreductase [Pseudomonadota bacterium]